MGIIKAAFNAIGGGLADQWLEVIEPDSMSDTTVMVSGVRVRAKDVRNNNIKGTDRTVSNGSIIHVYPNQFMMLVDGGRIIDYTAEEGYYKVSNSSMPSMFNGELEDVLWETFDRIKLGGVTSGVQHVYYINLQEIKGIKFGTRNAINYFDSFYNAELFLRAHGSYSIKIVDPLKFFAEAIPRDKTRVDINDINEQYLSEFLTALQAAINQMSADGIRISLVTSKSLELAKYMADVLDSDWSQMRGMKVQSVGIASISYDDESKELINMRNQGAMLQDASIREGYVQGSIARGMEAAGSNPGGSMNGFMGVGLGMQSAGNFMAEASRTNQFQMQQQYRREWSYSEGGTDPSKGGTKAPGGGAAGTGQWKCGCGRTNSGKFCEQCGAVNTGRFCSECGSKRPGESAGYRCGKCGFESEDTGSLPKFCPECGAPFKDGDKK